jgi:phosphoadenosine phosphosulfate reductase
VFCDTGVEAKETYDYVKTIDNLITVRGDRTFWQIVEEHGMPVMKGSGKNRINACCEILKDKPMKKALKDYGWDLLFDGLTQDESWQRRMFLRHYGSYHKVTSWGGVWKCHPIHDWSEGEVWAYLNENNILYNDIYKPPRYAKRCGCQPCTAYLSWEDRLRCENPKLYKLVSSKKKGSYTPPIQDYAFDADREDCPI